MEGIVMRLLIVEDKLGIREGINTSLSEKGYSVDTAVDGEEGLYKALNWSYDLILIDSKIPKLNGWQVFNRLRQEKNTPVVMIKANWYIYGRDNYREIGTDDFIARLRLIVKNKLNTTSMLFFYQF
jgi:DNA-binding response OmpR family regulator